MAFPEGVPTVLVRHEATNPVGGGPGEGTVTFAPTAVAIKLPGVPDVFTGSGTYSIVDGVLVDGETEGVQLLPNDIPGANPASFAWLVTVNLIGAPVRSFYIQLSVDQPEVDLGDIQEIDPDRAEYVPVAGSAGPAGPAGPAGETGPQGETGATGPQGQPGPQGASGPPGPAGADGSDGQDGAQGPIGLQGEPGAQGPAGPAGAQGATGATGPQPPLGAAGAGDTIALKSTDPTTTNPRTPTVHAANHRTSGTDPLTAADVGADTAGAATAAVTSHAAAADPHGDRAYTDTQIATRVPTSRQITAGTGLTGGGNLTADRSLAVAFGTTGTTAAAGNDSRLSDARTPTVHATSHNSGGSDPISLAGIGAYPASSGTALEQTQSDLPSEQGLLAWTYDPNQAGHVTAQSNAGVAGRITLVRLILRKQITWSNIWLGLAGVDAAAVLANCYLGVYDSSGTLKGATADISTSLMSGAVAKPLALAAPFTAAAGTYFIAMLLNGTWATNSLTFKASGAGSSTNAGLAAPNLRYSNMLSAQTTLPASLALSGQTTTIINTGWASQWYGVS
ncbi:collagen-like protein [Streptomyces sp. NRRL B-24720]|uniref:collagen-like protein n=1 Tax=Streptomyces sp. NRRL B-24720 TaxID=1476876 RepID=UPI00099CE4F2|nr:collagen-like protein [Streptomyces sp. NRRL B-24720]